MHKLLVTLGACSAFLLCSVSLAAENKASDDAVRVYEVYGMDCPGCHGGLEKLVEKIPAVQRAQANWKKKLLKVWPHKGRLINDNDVYAAIKRANFTPGKRLK